MSDIPEENYNLAFGKKEDMRVILEKRGPHKPNENEFDSHTRYNKEDEKDGKSS